MKLNRKNILKEGLFTNLLKTSVKTLPSTFKYLDDITRLMTPEVKAIANTTTPTILNITEGVSKRFFKDFFTSTNQLSRNVTKVSMEGLTQKGIQNLIGLRKNISDLLNLTNVSPGAKIDAKNLINAAHSTKNGVDNLVNELKLIKPNSADLTVAKEMQTQIDDVISKNNTIFKNATMGTSTSTNPKPVVKPKVEPKSLTKPKVEPKPMVKPKVEPKPTVKTKVEPKVKSSSPKVEIPLGNFNEVQIIRGSYNLPTQKSARFVDQLLEKSFYEGFGKRHDMWSDEIINQLTPETKSYLLQLKKNLEKEGLLYTNGFKQEFKRLPKTADEEIKLLSGNHWGGLGRRMGAQNSIKSLPIPNNSVIQNLLDKTMQSSKKEEILQLYKTLFNK